MKEIMNAEQITRTLKRMTHEIIERNQNLNEIVFVGIMKKGYPIAELLKNNFKKFADIDAPLYALDISAYRDDLIEKPQANHQSLDIHNKIVILVDDVLYTGRSARAAMDALSDQGRPKQIELAIMIDRGHRELPIRADFTGKNIPTSQLEKVVVDIEKMNVYIEERGA